ncbi:MAG TPA: sulfotransferase, partial [Polyangiales bacterium]
MPVPTFIIAGERRSGTTSLYAWMKVHPQVYLHDKTDENYFVESELSSRSWIAGKVDAARWEATHDPQGYGGLFAAANGQRAIGHKGADLLYWRPAHPRIARFVPEARLVITLRDPVKRAWSQYWNEVGKGREWLGFEQALAHEDARRRTSEYADFHLAYRARGYYETSFEHLFRHVERSRVLVVTVEETRKRPRETLQQIYRFLGVDPELGLELA